jgi:hypothetical protein
VMDTVGDELFNPVKGLIASHQSIACVA